jgi:vacuolar-type H+-ATPase subunit F/Vma7
MSTELRILCRPEVATGFSLTSLPVLEASTAADAAEILRPLLDDRSVGVVLIEERFRNGLPEDVQRRISRQPAPLVVPFPSPEELDQADTAESYIVELLRQVIGYRVRLR